MQELTLKLTVDEASIILDALGDRPFKDVFALIGKIQEQAQQQLNENGVASEDATSPDEFTSDS